MNNKTESKELEVDFNLHKEVMDKYNPNFISALGLHYLYLNETKHLTHYKNYFDTLQYFKKSLMFFNLSDTNYFVLVKPRQNFGLADPIYGFTKDKFYLYEPKEVMIKNFPVDFMRRSSDNETGQ